MSFDLDPDNQHFLDAMHLHRRHLSEERMRRYEDYMAEIFTAFGLDLDTPATRETPQRFLRAMFDSTEATKAIQSCSRCSRPSAAVDRIAV